MNVLKKYSFSLILMYLFYPVSIFAQSPEASVKPKHFTISGYIIDENSKETLLGATIFETTNSVGTSTNEYGFYSITLPQGALLLRLSYVGYLPLEKIIELNENMKLDIQLKTNTELKEVFVYGNKSETGINATHMGSVDIPIGQIKNTPALLGESDVMKTIQMMPGVQAGTEGSSGVYVRGGGSDENLILLDGVPLYNVDHVFGFFSVFTPESVKKVSLYKGSFPARFGGRLSSVIDVRTNDGNMQEYHGTVGLGLLSAKAQFEGPIIKNRTAFNISARRSYLDLLARPFMDKNDKFGYYFYDINAKVNHRFSDKHRLYLSFYNGRDKLSSDFKDSWDSYRSEDNNNLKWGNLTTALRWNYVISPKLFSNTTIAYTQYNFKSIYQSLERSVANSLQQDRNYSSIYSSGIKDWTYNIDFDYRPLAQHHIKFGANYLYHNFKPEVLTSRIKNDQETDRDITYNSISNSNILAHEASAYIEDNFDIGQRFSLNAGMHFSMFRVQDKSYFSTQPRISARYQLTDNIALKGAYTQMNQYIHLLSSYTIAMPTDLWLPSTKNIRPMKAHQYSLGTYYTGIKGWEFSVEGYYKDMRNVLEYKDGASFMGSSHNWEDKVEMGKGRAMGLEFMAQKTIGKTTGWIAYTLAKSDRQFALDGINDGERFPYKYDRRHNISLAFIHKFSERFDMSASWRFYTGGTSTIAQEKTIIVRPDGQTSVADYVEKRNNFRLPSSHYLSLGANFHKKTKHGSRTINISIHNVYNAMNPTLIYRDTKSTDGGYSGKEKPILKKVTFLPFIPSVSYIYKF